MREGHIMPNRIAAAAWMVLSGLAVTGWSQSVVSTHSGVVYYFGGTVYVGNDQLVQKFGRFPDIPEGGELRTEHGRAEVLLTPGVILRVGESSSIRMISSKLSDTRVELLRGVGILEAAAGDSNVTGKDTRTTLVLDKWEMRVPHEGVFRIDADPAQVKVYKGEIEVNAVGSADKVKVKENETMPLAAVLVSEAASGPEKDDFKSWAMSRSQAVSADNAVAAGIIDDPNQMDTTGTALGSLTYFPTTGWASMGIANPYGLSFWSPYQSILTSLYLPFSAYPYGPIFMGVGGPRGWPVGYGTHTGYPGYSGIRPIYPRPIVTPVPLGLGTHPGGFGGARPIYTTPGRGIPAAPHVSAPHPSIHR